MKKIPIWAIILILLLLANLGRMWWNVSRYSGLRAAGKEFKIEVLHTNGVSGVGIFERKTEQPLWVEWDFNGDGKADQENYFFRGKDVFDVTFSSNRPPKFSVYFRGSGKSATWWIDDGGNGAFTERIYYNTDGNFYRREVWYNEAWRTVDRRNEKNGIIINGQWHQLTFDTNDMWTIETP
jgi:hypothetical protein